MQYAIRKKQISRFSSEISILHVNQTTSKKSLKWLVSITIENIASLFYVNKFHLPSTEVLLLRFLRDLYHQKTMLQILWPQKIILSLITELFTVNNGPQTLIVFVVQYSKS